MSEISHITDITSNIKTWSRRSKNLLEFGCSGARFAPQLGTGRAKPHTERSKLAELAQPCYPGLRLSRSTAHCLFRHTLRVLRHKDGGPWNRAGKARGLGARRARKPHGRSGEVNHNHPIQAFDFLPVRLLWPPLPPSPLPRGSALVGTLRLSCFLHMVVP